MLLEVLMRRLFGAVEKSCQFHQYMLELVPGGGVRIDCRKTGFRDLATSHSGEQIVFSPEWGEFWLPIIRLERGIHFEGLPSDLKSDGAFHDKFAAPANIADRPGIRRFDQP